MKKEVPPERWRKAMPILQVDNLERMLADGLIIRGQWAAKGDDGRQRLCAYTALFNDPTARPENCPAWAMPGWMAELIPWMDDKGTGNAWSAQMTRLAVVARHFESFTPMQWEEASKRIRIGIIGEALSHITVDKWGVRSACEQVIKAIKSGMELAAAGAAAGAVAEAAAWAAAGAAARAATGAAAWAAAGAAARNAARNAAEAAAGAAAEAAAMAAAEAAAEAAASDRIIDLILTTLEEQCKHN